MRDDIHKLPLSSQAKRYARMTSKDLGSNWSKKADYYIDMVAADTNQSKEGFPNRDAAGKVKHTFSESLVRVLLDWADDEGIRAAAVKTHDGTIFTGKVHWEAAMKAKQAGHDFDDEDLGFVTTRGRFVSREEAEMIGVHQGQVSKDIQDPAMIHAAEFTHYL